MELNLGGVVTNACFSVRALADEGEIDLVLTLHDVPFFGQYEEDTGEVTVGIVWTEDELIAAIDEEHDLDEFVILSTPEEQVDELNDAINHLISLDPIAWIA